MSSYSRIYIKFFVIHILIPFTWNIWIFWRRLSHFTFMLICESSWCVREMFGILNIVEVIIQGALNVQYSGGCYILRSYALARDSVDVNSGPFVTLISSYGSLDDRHQVSQIRPYVHPHNSYRTHDRIQ